jgi:transposase
MSIHEASEVIYNTARRIRQAESVPILAKFKAWLDEQINAVLPKSALGQAVSYALKNWDALTRYAEHGQLEADNNYAERCMRPVAVGRKAYLFVGSESNIAEIG